ncbi:MAG: rod shape-determining protein MreD [Pyrinomonadaceae bacterium]
MKLTIALAVAVALQWTLRNVAEPFAYVDFPLIIVVYAALQRNSIRAIFYATFAGLAVDALSSGLLGSSGFTKTLVAYIVSEVARRVYMDNVLLRIPVIAAASLVSTTLSFALHKLLGQEPNVQVIPVVAYSLIGTTIAGTAVFVLLDHFLKERVRRPKRDVFTPRRQTRRRNPIRLGK